MRSIEFKEFSPRIFNLWANQWMLLTSGDFDTGHYNTMTVAWGSIGQMWNKPFVQVVVRPTRYTYEFMEKYNTFTLCAFPKKYKSALNLLGTKSGKDGDKIAESKLNPIKSKLVASPSFAEAELIIECRKIYWDDFEPANFLIPDIETNYNENDYHRVYFGEVVQILVKD